MKTHIFIRSYWADVNWLSYCLRSINKFARGFEGVTIVCPYDSMEILCPVCEAAGHSLPLPSKYDGTEGYVDQMVDKMYADAYLPLDTELIMYMDSDCFLTTNITPDTFLINGKPRLIREKFDRFVGEPVYQWKAIVEKALGVDNIEYETMRCHPFCYLPSTLQRTRRWLIDQHNLPLEHYVRTLPYRQFSEFNVAGNVALMTEGDKYSVWTIPEDGIPPAVLNQAWSWGGLDDERKEWMEGFLK